MKITVLHVFPRERVMQPISVLPSHGWSGPYHADVRERALADLEAGRVLFLPDLAFPLDEHERAFLSPATVDRSKNVSFDPARGKLGGTAVTGVKLEELRNLMSNFARATRRLLAALLPAYQGGIRQARTSLRPVEIAGRASSWRKDDTRLHVDSFPSQPTGGQRILRVFSNVNHHGRPRVWRVGGPFESVARRFWPALRRPLPGARAVLRLLRVTKTRRTSYDHYMLQLHDRMKEDGDFQAGAEQLTHAFPAGSTWVVFTDQVPHAAMSGIHQLEQTFSVPVSSLRAPHTAPLRVLEGLARRRLA
jgi:hypothetical protein